MRPPRIYVETTIPSMYYDTRAAPVIVAMREDTRRWWADAIRTCELVTGSPTLQELSSGPPDRRRSWLGLIQELPVLTTTDEVLTVAEYYVRHKLVPAEPRFDALHLALATLYHWDVLVSWDIRHLANENKRTHIDRVHAQLGVEPPMVATPRRLLWRAT